MICERRQRVSRLLNVCQYGIVLWKITELDIDSRIDDYGDKGILVQSLPDRSSGNIVLRRSASHLIQDHHVKWWTCDSKGVVKAGFYRAVARDLGFNRFLHHSGYGRIVLDN